MDKYLADKKIRVKFAFPKKTWFYKDFSAESIANRQSKLNEFLHALSGKLDLLEIPLACEFLDVNTHTKTLLLSLRYEIRALPTASPKIDPLDLDVCDSLCLSGRKEEMKIQEFLIKLNTHEDAIAKAVQCFEDYYFEKAPVFTKDEIKMLLWGSMKEKGLLYFCGNGGLRVTKSACLQLFAKFLRYEYNSVKTTEFLDVYSMTEPELIKQMNLDYLIKEVMTPDSSGLLSLYYYLKYNTHNITEPQEILTDPKSIGEYNKWIQNKIVCGTGPSHPHRLPGQAIRAEVLKQGHDVRV